MNTTLNNRPAKTLRLKNTLPSGLFRLSRFIPRAIPTILILSLIALSVNWFYDNGQETRQTADYITSPKVDDLYFLDFRLLPQVNRDTLRPNEKYRLAKIVDITGDVVTLVYGNFFYLRQQAIERSIHYGQLRYPDYFETRRYDFDISELKNMANIDAIYMVKRPQFNKLFGNDISPSKEAVNSKNFIPGKKQNNSGLAFLKQSALETHLQQAFEDFYASAELAYAPGQINLAQMYLTGQHVDQDLNQALYWFKRAALQSHKPGILKYGIVCKQVAECNIVDFYDELIASGVNIKIRTLDFTLE